MSDKQPFVFKWQHGLVMDDRLSAADRHIALTLALHMDKDGGSCFPSISLLALETRRKRNTIVASVNTLEHAGWLKVKRGGIGFKKDVNRYTAKYPKGYLDAESVSTPRGSLQVSEGVLELPSSSPARTTKKAAAAECEKCGLGGGHHVDGCEAIGEAA